MYWFILGLAIGILAAVAITYIFNRARGTIWVVRSKDEPPCLLLELDNEMDSVEQRKKVIFRVRRAQK